MTVIVDQVNWKYECGVNAKARAVAEAEAFESREKIRRIDERYQLAEQERREADESTRILLKLTGQQGSEIRRLRAMVLRAHAVSFSLFECYCPDHEDPNPIGVKRPWMFNAFWSNRAARLLRHWANAIEAGRL